MNQDNVISTELTPMVSTSTVSTATVITSTMNPEGAVRVTDILSSTYGSLTTTGSSTTSSLNALIAKSPNAEDTPSDIFNSALSSLRTDLGADKVNYLQKVITNYLDFSIANALSSQSMAIHPILKERDILENKLTELKIEYAKAIEAKAINSKGE